MPELWADDLPLRDALRARGIEAEAVSWDDATTDWASYDLVVIRSPWDYVPRREEFIAWAHRVPRLLNPADVLEWNTDKRYLGELARSGLPVTPTEFVSPSETWTPPRTGEWVVKPTVSAGSQDTGRYVLPEQAGLAAAHVTRLTSAGRTAMIQPYLAAVATLGETALIYLPDDTGDLSYSHAIRKGPMLRGPGEGAHDPGSEQIDPREPTEAERRAGDRVLEAIPGGTKRLLYARVDLIPGPDGDPLLVELELAEPSLFLRSAEGATRRLTEAVLSRL
ncbi:ATP-grasp domain-containing protein [Paractinoplanes bogorensis]|nr:hypothetical protein [Actinoplanes bogorensis]